MAKRMTNQEQQMIINANEDVFDALDLGMSYRMYTNLTRERRTSPADPKPQSYLVVPEHKWGKLEEHYQNSCIVVRKFCIKMSGTT